MRNAHALATGLVLFAALGAPVPGAAGPLAPISLFDQGANGASGGSYPIAGGSGDGGASGSSFGVSVAGSATITNAGPGISIVSLGGNGGNGGDGIGLILPGFGGNAGGGGHGGALGVSSSAQIFTSGANAAGILLLSQAGNGGTGGSGIGIVGGGGNGGGGGQGGFLNVTQRGLVHTDGAGAAGIAAITRGGFGGGPGVGGGLIGYGGSGNASGSGGAITILNTGTIETLGTLSEGVLAQSIGGFGGSGGSGGGLFFFGGVGVTGGDGGAVAVTNRGVIHTGGAESHGLYLQSVGGGGGRGGSGGGLLALGGDGSAGGNGGLVTAANSGEIATVGDFARGIFAQSIGGGGGSGGATGAAIAIGGRGSSTGFGNTVDVTNTGTVRTRGIDSHALFAQSVGGGGGSGGTAGGWFAFGGRGAAGGNGGAVNVTNRGLLATLERDSAGIFAQSIGGGGGDGGDAGSLGAFLSLAWGGAAGPGGNAACVDVAHEAGAIATGGNNSHGIVAQSVGGGGGAGGYAFSGAVGTKFAVSAAIGGSGGAGGAGGAVEVTGAGAIATGGDFAHGVLAESVGGGGGSGGIAIAASASEGVSASLAFGGTGGSGGSGGKVDVDVSGAIETTGLGSAGVFAQSVGGGGGNGGLAVAVSLTIPQPAKTTNFGLSLGGNGGPGGIGGEVDATSRGAIVTRGNESSAIFAQSVGGGGGKGGGSFTAVINPAAAGGQNVNLGIAVGGGGGTGRTGGAVDVTNTGSLTTLGELSHGIFAQSVGGGGGAGGSSRALTVQFGFDSPASNKSAVFSVGGSGGGASDGGAVTVKNAGEIVTQGADSVGIWAQSVGGGGGEGGNGAHGVGNATTLPPGLSATKIYKDLQVVVGGSAGSSGNGDAVRVEQTGRIATSGDGADAIFVQSIGAGGGVGGKAIQGLTGKIAVGGAGGAAGNGGRIDVVLDGDIETFGTAAYGISAASIGGGGGAGGNVDRGFLGFGIVPAFGQGGGSAGNGGVVEIRGTGDITTHGAASHGIFAQSIGGGGGLVGDFGGGLAFAGSVGGDGVGEDVTIVHAGDVRANGAGSDAIFAQSVGPDGNGDVAVTIAAGGTVQGGSGAGVGIQFADGAANRLTNAGTVWALSGVAIAGTTGNESLANDGRVVGSVLLGTGVNAFHNRTAGWLDAGSRLDLGGGLLTNDGLLTLGAAGLHRDTLLSGGFQQNATGTTLVRIAPLGGADRLLVAGHAALGGDLTVQRSPGYVVNGTTWEVLHAASATGTFATETLPAAAPLLAFDVDYRTGPAPGTSVVVRASALPFDTFATTRVGRNTARYLQSIAAITTGGLNLAMGELQVLPLGEHDPAYVALSSETHDAYTTATVDTNKRYGENVREQMRAGRALQRARYADYLISSDGEEQALPPVGALREFHGLQMWIAPLYDGGEVEEQGGFTGYSADVWGTSAGAQVRLDRRSFFGFSGGFAKTRLDLDQSEGMGQVKSGYATLFGSVWGNRWFGQALLSYGHHRFEDERLTQFGAIDEVAKSDHDGQSISLALDLGLDARAIRAWNAAPYASLEFAYLSEDAYTERGPGALLLSIERRDTNSLVSELGVRFVAAPRAFGPVTPELTLGWRHDYDVDARTLSGRFVTGPVTPFALAGRYIQQDAARLGFSLRVDREDSPFNVTLQTQTLLGSDARDYLANLRFGYAF